MKKGTSYELLTKEIYQILLNYEWPGKNICVEHDIKLLGASGQKHQIDVYWEYELAGIKHRVAIECKEHNKPLAIGIVRDFYGVLYDLKDVKGILVSANGFQKGAKEYAKTYGINLKELSISHETPVFAELEMNFHTSIRRTLFLIDEKWASQYDWDINQYRTRLSTMSLKKNEWLIATHLPLDTINSLIVDSEGNKISSIEELESKIDPNVIDGTKYLYPFENGFVITPSGLVKIKEILISDIEEDHSETFSLTADGFVKAILKDAVSGNIQNILYPQNAL